MFEKMIENVRNQVPLIHCITNYVTVNDVANALLACGGSPIMADDVSDAVDITAICGGLNINLGTLNERTVLAMQKAGKRANSLGHFTILDPVGAGASQMRTETTFALMKEIKFSVIRGNISEIKTIYYGFGSTQGVDADSKDAVTEENLEEMVQFAQSLSEKIGSVIVITGAIDIVAGSRQAFVIRNGHSMLSKITGSGCMLTALIAAFCTANPDRILEASAAAVSVMGYAGELAEKKVRLTETGTGSFRTFLIDALSNMQDQNWKEGAKIEVR